MIASVPRYVHSIISGDKKITVWQSAAIGSAKSPAKEISDGRHGRPI